MPPQPDHSAQALASRSYPVQEDMPFQRATWRVERAGWAVLCALVVLALLGLFSNGPLSASTETDDTGRLGIDYDRFHRSGAAGALTIRIAAADAADPVTLRIGAEFLRTFRIETVTPEPVEQAGGPQGVDMTFLASAEGPLEIRFGIRPDRIGSVDTEIGLADEPPARLAQFVFP